MGNRVYQRERKLTRDKFFRLNFILQDNSASTNRTYLSKIVEFILFDSGQALSINDIQSRIVEKTSLQFSEDEIIRALSKSIKERSIVKNHDEFLLEPLFHEKITKERTLEEEIKESVSEAINDLELSCTIQELYVLITRYLYYCFNTNKNLLLSLIGNHISEAESIEFNATNNEKTIINKFLGWNNPQKDRLLYKVVSYCYVYCCLNTKKDALLSKNIFKNKRFYLDANIIFRLAGINRDDRKQTIKSFVKKCNELGIKLCYTDITLDEIYRVLDSTIIWLNKVCASTGPIDLGKYDVEQNDFYSLYVEWSKNNNTSIGDIEAYRYYLISLINETVDELEYVNVSIKIKNDDEKNLYQSKLLELKNQHQPYKKHSDKSAKTDIDNISFVYSERTNKLTGDIFSINDYFITADQVLIEWANDTFLGVPITVLPSLWLTIMLRFTGRTDDDYKAFCSFMNLRLNNMVDNLDIFSVLSELNFHTNDKVLKEKIVTEIVANKDVYKSAYEASGDLEDTINKAFDVVSTRDKDDIIATYEKEIHDREEALRKLNDEQIMFERKNECESNIEKLARSDASQEIGRRKKILFIWLVLSWFIIVVSFLVFIGWAYEVPILYDICEVIIPRRFESNPLDYLEKLGAALLIIPNAISYLISKISSKNAEQRIYTKAKKKYSEKLMK